jgi:DNA polymerase II small subunit/DNA polymerase delta subunit B
MKIKEFKTTYNDIYVIPISDVHLGDKGFTKECEKKLKGYINWVKTTPNAFVILNGDLVNCATRLSKSSPFDQNMDLAEQIEGIVELLKPIKNKILGAINGNHENRLSDYTGYSPTISICERLGIDYLGDSATYILRLGCRKKLNSPRLSFTIYSHHTTGGGNSIGSKINRIASMREIVANADVFVGSHNHMLGAIHGVTQIINETTSKLETVRQMIVDTGGYLDWNNTYAERNMLAPLRIGSPRIHLIVKRNSKSGNEIISKDVHISI